MLASRSLGLGASLRHAVFAPRLPRNPSALRRIIPRRSVQTESFSPSQATDILNKQRLRRPSSPHFTIYQPQLTWIGSIVNRGTGAALSALLYGFSIAYLVAPATFDSTHVVETVAALPESIKYAGKALLAAPFAFHSLNGIRHLSWDMGKFLSLKGAYASGYVVIGATAITTIALTLYK